MKKDIKSVTAAPTVDTAIYASGDLLSSKMTFTDALGGAQFARVMTVVVRDLDKQNAAMDLILFDQDPTGTTQTLNGAFSIAAADLPKIVGHVSIVAGDYSSMGGSSVATKANVQLALESGTSTTLYGLLVSRGTPTYTTAGSITVTLTTERG